MTDTTFAELEELIDARLAAMGLAPPGAPRVAVDPDGTPGNVASGELIESAWGNSVVANIDALHESEPVSTGPYVGGWPTGTWPDTPRHWRAGHATVTPSAFGDAAVNFQSSIPTGTIAITVTPTHLSDGVWWWPVIRSVSLNGFGLWAVSTQGAPFATAHPPGQAGVWTITGTPITFDYMALGV